MALPGSGVYCVGCDKQHPPGALPCSPGVRSLLQIPQSAIMLGKSYLERIWREGDLDRPVILYARRDGSIGHFEKLTEPAQCSIATAAFGDKPEIKSPEPPAPDIDRIWDMVVLAARTSRYGE